MATQKSIIPDAELNVLKALWHRSPLTARDIAERLYKAATKTSMGTVQQLIVRLERKNMISRDSNQIPHKFAPSIKQEDIAGRQMEDFAKKGFGGSLSPFVMHLVNAKKLTESDKEEIRRLLDES